MSQEGIIDVIGSNPQIPTDFIANIGNAVPIANTLEILGVGTILTTGSGNTITIESTTSGVSWQTISASQALDVDTGYICVAPGGALILSLPAVSVLGDTIEITLDGSTSFSVTQGAGQQIRFGNQATTAGVGGSITSTQQGDSIRMVCQTANLKWNIISSIGNPTVV